MMRSLFSGVSGLKTHQQRMDVIGNNIANVNTTAFKSSSTTFQDIMYQTMSYASGGSNTRGGVNARQIGLGVTTAATKVSISTSGSAETTNDGLDLRLSDKNATNFFIVNNGSSNVFTRSGSFYVDGNGYLSMTSTGYHVMGWQSNKELGTIQRNTVSALHIMSADNQTSQPEWTTNAHLEGLIDKDDTNVNSPDGYLMNLTFYDNLGYAYTARFSVKKGEDQYETSSSTATSGSTQGQQTSNGYTISLDSITSDSNVDASGNPIDLLEQYINSDISKDDANRPGTIHGQTLSAYTENPTSAADLQNNALLKAYSKSKIFGDVDGYSTDSFKLNSPEYSLSADGATIYKGTGSNRKSCSVQDALTAINDADGGPNAMLDFSGTQIQASQVFSGLSAAANNYYVKDNNGDVYKGADGNDDPTLVTGFVASFDTDTQSINIQTDSTNYDLLFKTSDGTLEQVVGRNSDATGTEAKRGLGNDGGTTQTLRLSALGSQFSDITIDFSELLNYDNGGNSTGSIDRGTINDASNGAGRRLGTLNGITVQTDGRIYGSYTNGNTELLGQIATTQFANASGLESLGDNTYGETLNSGSFDGIGQPIDSDGSSMNSGQLEMSNVDLAQEFTTMITTQRGFQANSRIITVSDTLLEELTNLKR